MFGGFGGGFDPSKMKGLMKQMGIKQEEIDSDRVVIEKKDGTKIVIEEAAVQKMIMQGHESWQITGKAHEEEEGIKEEDVKLVMEKTGANEKEATKALEECGGEVAEAIVKLSD